jgi:hypothetical protein
VPHYPTWDYVPVKHDFEYTAEIAWPGRVGEQLDWIIGITHVEWWLEQYTGAKYSRWAWNMATESYHISVAFKYDKHRMLFLLNYA